ncbi:MAG: hypothetical protein KZQ58_09800 [gamma proteobacterium symbiont of Bathyaustriella thionipta]|nr:hypothetical protein [gamma proteobacterium symbiont of Bathyaustriella thionipta]
MHKRVFSTFFCPPLIVCRLACHTSCASPVSVIWLAAVAALILGLLGGPALHGGLGWGSLSVASALWVIAALWAWCATRSFKEDSCQL